MIRKSLQISIIATVLVALVPLPTAVAQGCYQLPFSNPTLSDGWGSTCCGRTNPHRGVDFPQATGTPIPAVASGVVRVNTSTGCLGNVVVVEHADGMFSGYSHLVNRSPLSVGTSVARGQTVGHVGNTGTCSFGAHLHLTLAPTRDGYYTGVTVDPYAYITSHMGSGAAESCNGSDDDCDSRVDEGDVCEVALLLDQPSAYAPPRTTDVNADGRADLCARGADGLRCWPSSGAGWETSWAPIPWSDESGWNDVQNYATLRMGDLNDDGRADVCARSNSDVLCALSNGTGFGAATVWRAGISDANGWNVPQHYTSLRLADVDGDGSDDLCALDSLGFGCWLATGTTFDQRIEGPRWSSAGGFGRARYYGTLRMGDLNGDRRADVCIRHSDGVQCWLSDGAGFPTVVDGPAWSDARGFGAMQYWSTMRLADVNGDARDDLCVRTAADLRCVLATADGSFGETVIVAALSDANGWNDVTNYGTLRVGDIDRDGAQDLCLRSNAAVLCFTWDGSAFVQRDGPAWSDAGGWAVSEHYQTIRLVDFDGDGRSDACARAGAGWRCHPSSGTAFGDAVTFDELTNAGGWAGHRYWSTIMSGGPACRPVDELCNGLDDDCDGEVDEQSVCASPDGGGGALPDGGGVVMPLPDGGGGVLPRIDGGARSDAGSARPRDPSISSGCGCRAAGGEERGSWLALGMLGIMMIAMRLRAARRRSQP